MYEVMLFSEILAQHRDLLEAGTNVVWTLSAKAEGEQPRLSAQKIEKLDDVAARAAAGIRILVEDRKSVGEGKSGSVGVDLGGRSLIKKKKLKSHTRDADDKK